MTDFDEILDRSLSASEKWNKKDWLEYFGVDELLPFWVADMEFRAPPAVYEQLVKRAENGIFGYEYRPDNLTDSITHWFEHRHQWKIKPSDLCFSTSVLNAISILINLHTEEGDGIIVQPPVFFEFRLVIVNNKRKVVRNPLRLVDSRYEMDLDDLEEKASDPRTKMLILCNPHNPVGRVWTRDELKRVADICKKHQVLIIADEIHCDIVYSGYRYVPFGSLSEEAAQQSFSCLSPAKSFNVASVTDAMVVISNQQYREQYNEFVGRYLFQKNNAFNSVAMETAYRKGGPWLDELLVYLQENLDYLDSYLKERIPQVKLIKTEGTFLAWLDFRELGMDAKELEKFIAHEARIAINPGYWFGRQGAGFARMTIACPRSMLKEGLSRLEKAISGLERDG